MKITYIIKKSSRKSLGMTVCSDKENTVLIKAPYGISIDQVEAFIKEKRDWIIKQLEKKEGEKVLAQKMGLISPSELRQIKLKAKKIIPERVEHYAAISGITYNRIFIRLQKSRWGSCSVDGNLNFNCLLVLMPLEILDSVVVHELCHRLHMNHSKAFYEEVLRLFPDYKSCDKWLKQNGGAYFKRLEM